MQKSCICDFLHGPLTTVYAIQVVIDALKGTDEKQVEVFYYKKDGKLCMLANDDSGNGLRVILKIIITIWGRAEI